MFFLRPNIFDMKIDYKKLAKFLVAGVILTILYQVL